MVNKLKALAERVEHYRTEAILTAQRVSSVKKMRETLEAQGMEMGLTRAVMADMLPTLKEAAALTVPALPMPEPTITLSGWEIPKDWIADPVTFSGGPLVIDSLGVAPFDRDGSDGTFSGMGGDLAAGGASATARTPEPMTPLEEAAARA